MQTVIDKDKALNKAKVGIMSRPNTVFISTILFSLKFSWEDTIPTACTDGLSLYINPDWFTNLTDKARVGLLAHETWHVAFNHMLRSKNLDQKRFNKAADYVINNMLIEQGIELPPNGLWDVKYTGMSTEQVYALLPVSEPDDSYDCDIVSAGGNSDNPTDAEDKILDIIVKAALQSKMQNDAAGTIPNDIAILLDEKLNPKLPWNVILQNCMSEYAKEDYSYRKPNRKYFPEFYLPNLYSESIANIAVAVDSSGSVSDYEFSCFIAEIEDIRTSLNPKMTSIVGFDTEINTEYDLAQGDLITDVKFEGRGGTDLFPVFEHFKTKPPTVLIVFSDLWCDEVTEVPDYDVIWICVDNPKAKVNFGTLIHLSL